MSKGLMKKTALASSALCLMGGMALADQVINDDLIVSGGSLCVGFDCVNGESFGFDTIRMKENNVRIKAQDTSTSASFPNRDWQLTFNESSNGGANKFSIDDIDGGRTPFTIEAGAPSHSLYVDDGGRIGLGTSTPVAAIHIKDGDTPTLRLEQDGTSGFTPQIFDVAANETNFFVRDASNGSTLPFRIRPGAPSSAIDVAANGDVGIGTSSPAASLHIRRTGAAAGADLLTLQSNDILEMVFQNDSASSAVDVFKFVHAGSEFRILNQDTPGTTEFALDQNGNLSLLGNLTVNVGGTPSSFPDYVFDADYDLMPLNEVEQFIALNGHLPRVPSAADVAENGINVSALQITLLEKVEELTLYTLAQQKHIDELNAKLLD